MPLADPREPVSRLIRRGPVTVDPQATLRDVSEVLLREEVGVAIVSGDGSAIGLVSERDVIRALAEGADPDDERAGDVMVFEVVTVDAHEPVGGAAAQMLDGQIRHLLVVDGDRSVGVVSMRDVLAACIGEPPAA